MKKIRILHVVNKMDMGGTESMIMNLYRNIDHEKFVFDFLVHNNSKGYFDEEIRSLGGNIFFIPKFNGLNYIQYMRECNKFFKENQYDIVHGHISSSASFYLLVAKKSGAITIAHSHSIYAKSIHSIAHKLFTFSTRYIADYFFSPTLSAGCDRFGEKIVKSNKFFIVKNGFSIENYRFREDNRETVRNSFNFTEKDLVFINIGRFEEAKNHSFIIDVFSKICEKNEDCYLILIGIGTLKNKIMEKVKSLSIEDRVLFLENRTDIPNLLCAADLFIFPSLNEGLGISLIEAQATGIRCIVSENIPVEAILDDEKVKVEKISSGIDNWEEQSMKLLKYPNCRTRSYHLVEEAGYDIKDSTKKLENNYLSFYERN